MLLSIGWLSSGMSQVTGASALGSGYAAPATPPVPNRFVEGPDAPGVWPSDLHAARIAASEGNATPFMPARLRNSRRLSDRRRSERCASMPPPPCRSVEGTNDTAPPVAPLAPPGFLEPDRAALDERLQGQLDEVGHPVMVHVVTGAEELGPHWRDEVAELGTDLELVPLPHPPVRVGEEHGHAGEGRAVGAPHVPQPPVEQDRVARTREDGGRAGKLVVVVGRTLDRVPGSTMKLPRPGSER